MSAKCWSWVSIILLASLAIWAILPSSEPEGTTKTSWPVDSRKYLISLRTFSSTRNRILGRLGIGDEFAGLDYFRGIMQRGLDMFFGKLRVGLLNNVLGCLSIFKHLEYKIKKYAR